MPRDCALQAACVCCFAAVTLSLLRRNSLSSTADAAASPLPGPAGRSAPTERTVEEVRVLGNTTVSNAIIRNLIRTREGDKFDPATVQEDYQRVFELKKFSNVEARKSSRPRSGGVIVVFVVTEQKLIKSVTFKGNSKVDIQTLQNAVEVKPGQAIDNFRIALSRQAIEATLPR